MKTSIVALFMLTTVFMWSPPESGNPTARYHVELADKLGQVVETATVEGVIYRTDYEGALRLSVAGIDEKGDIGSYSEWSSAIITPKEVEFVLDFSNKVDVTFLAFIGGYMNTITVIWEDPHETNK